VSEASQSRNHGLTLQRVSADAVLSAWLIRYASNAVAALLCVRYLLADDLGLAARGANGVVSL